MSKGSSPRPFLVSNEEYSNRLDAIFGRDNEKENKAPTLETSQSIETRPTGRSDNRIQSVGQAENEGTGGN